MVGNAYDVAGKRFLQQFSSLREERYDGARANVFAGARNAQFHTALKSARAYPQESDAVAMCRVHVRLNLEYYAGESGFVWIHHAFERHTRRRRWGQIDQCVEYFAYAKIVYGRTKK